MSSQKCRPKVTGVAGGGAGAGTKAEQAAQQVAGKDHADWLLPTMQPMQPVLRCLLERVRG